MTDTSANKCHVKLQNIALRPLENFENQQTGKLYGIQHHPPGGCDITASEGYSPRHCYSSCPGQHPLLDPLPCSWIVSAILFQWIRFPLEKVFSSV